jgi:hypothetical protein
MRLLLVLVVALVLVGTAEAARYPIYWPAVTSLASEIAGRPVDIYCESPGEWAGDPVHLELGDGNLAYTWFHTATLPGYAVLSPYICGGLVLLLADPNEQSGISGYYEREGIALIAFLHETIHLRDRTRNEALVQCRALKELPSLIARIGVSLVNADRLISAAHAHNATLPPHYHGATC